MRPILISFVLPLSLLSAFSCQTVMAQHEKTVISSWSFEEVTDSQTKDGVSELRDQVYGKYSMVRGVEGNALRIDGFRTFICRDNDAPHIPSKSTIGTNSWEVPNDPQGFYPFEIPYLQTAYGAHFAGPDKFQYSPDLPDDMHSISILIGAIQYGNGKVILDASYWVDDNHPLNDMLFYNFIKDGSAKIAN